ncbi:MAG: transaldolase [Chloroflexi bacterium]|nr:transaldolase [Chloroflexota bacterium]
MTRLHELYAQGQSVWIDFIRRSFIVSGELQEWLNKGARGVTSNPTIFNKAITGSSDYDVDLARLARQGLSVEQMYRVLTLDDIARAADVERPLWDESAGGDGFVSIEVSPRLAHDTAGTVAEARSIFSELGRPNVMIKIPATPEGIPAIEAVIAEGINVNVTLIFGRGEYRACAEAYMRGLERRLARGGAISRVASVASVFVSRLDTLADPQLAKLGAAELQGRLALANAKLTYADFEEMFAGPRWEGLARHGARVQRPLWASTGTKNPKYPDTLYVDELVGAHTVNTIPPATLDAVLDHGRTEPSVHLGVDEARRALLRLQELDVDLQTWTDQLLAEGVASFAASYDELLTGIERKAERLRS